MLKEKEFRFYEHFLRRRNRLIQQYHTAMTGKEKSRSLAKIYLMDEENYQAAEGGTISC